MLDGCCRATNSAQSHAKSLAHKHQCISHTPHQQALMWRILRTGVYPQLHPAQYLSTQFLTFQVKHPQYCLRIYGPVPRYLGKNHLGTRLLGKMASAERI
jgi:hypothetical protein